MKKAYLVLSDGRYFEGKAIGAVGESIGELVFTTGVVGYLETLTDPGFAGQIVVQTFPMIGNYGVIESDLEGKTSVRGYVVRELCDTPSNFRCEYELDTFLRNNGICGISGVDTRELTRILREEGVMNAKICPSLPENYDDIASYKVQSTIPTGGEPKVYDAQGEEKLSVALVDYGAKRSLINALCSRGCKVTVFSGDTSAEDILIASPQGIVLSGGGGDPRDNEYAIGQIAKLMGAVPMLGIGLGHQMIALAMGGKCEKLRCGHRGSNQPVRQISGGRTYITSQNHGYTVLADSVRGAEQIYVNANDGGCEGLIYPEKQCLTVQFHPDCKVDSCNTAFIYDEFINMMGGGENA